MLLIKFVDCCMNDVECSELFIVEGDLVFGMVKNVCNSEF